MSAQVETAQTRERAGQRPARDSSNRCPIPASSPRNSASEDNSNGDDGDQIFEAGEVLGVAGVEPGAVRVGGGGDE